LPSELYVTAARCPDRAIVIASEGRVANAQLRASEPLEARRLVLVGEHDHIEEIPPQASLTIDELARLQHVEPVRDPAELSSDFWESDEELDAFLADLRASRSASA
jgi:hypothetical protein